ncbi:MAG: TetR/AcrR family transcriptional regulator [Candidatus Aminicenantia bacterium]
MKKGTRKERETEERKKYIIEAAREMFARKGFASTTMDEIAEKTEFSKVTIYHYFKSKKELLSQIIFNAYNDLLIITQKILHEKREIPEKIKDLIHLHLQFVQNNKNIFKIFMAERGHVHIDMKKNFKRSILNSRAKMFNLLTQIFDQGIKVKQFKNFNPEDMALTLLGLLHSFSFEWILGEKKEPLDEKAEIIYQIFLTGIQKEETEIGN